MSESPELTPMIIPKGTRINIQGCSFYLADDTYVGDGDEESHAILQSVLSDEAKRMARCSHRVKSVKSEDGLRDYFIFD